MHPILLTIGHVAVSSYLTLYLIAMLAMFGLALKRAPRFGVAREVILDVTLWFGPGMLLGVRLWHGVQARAQFRGHWLDLLNPFRNGQIVGWSGTASTGGVVLGILAVYLYTVRHKQRFLAIADAGAVGYLLASGIGRIGCFLAGCCFGNPTDTWLGVVFPPEGHVNPFPLGTALWPTQLFYAGLELIGLFLIVRLERRYPFPGATFAMTVTYYALDRFLVEQVRYYPPAEILATLGPLTINLNHPLFAGLVLMSLVIWRRGRKLQRQEAPARNI